MIQVCADPIAIDHGLAVFQPVKIGPRRAFIAAVGFFGADADSCVFEDADALANGRGSENTGSVDA